MLSCDFKHECKIMRHRHISVNPLLPASPEGEILDWVSYLETVISVLFMGDVILYFADGDGTVTSPQRPSLASPPSLSPTPSFTSSILYNPSQAVWNVDTLAKYNLMLHFT